MVKRNGLLWWAGLRYDLYDLVVVDEVGNKVVGAGGVVNELDLRLSHGDDSGSVKHCAPLLSTKDSSRHLMEVRLNISPRSINDFTSVSYKYKSNLTAERSCNHFYTVLLGQA